MDGENMKDLEYILATKEIPKYTPDEMKAILTKECELNGKTHQISVCMEEFAELIEVICENTITGKIDMIHLKEELVDCWICLDYLSILFSIQPMPCMTYYDTEKCLNNCILNLSTGITKLSKCIREKANADIKIVSLMNTITETLYNIHKFYNIGTRDYQMHEIKCLKIERSEKRNLAKMETQENIILPDLSKLQEYTESDN
jgi:hypothetical protein